MTPRKSFFDCLEAAAPQGDAVSFEPVSNQSCDVDASMEVAAFVERSTPGIEVVPDTAGECRKAKSMAGTTMGSAFAEAAGY
ncbi:hypothetical protein [Burkholderia multivorans]|uniref:hypothetical protein n=1 Tax=Burkholderia multivorans TaxID=87883 RepID=UPI0011B53CD4|nr:hypothetical protein [Burkholderia multivorans]MBR7900340.1 hypothetical protein [Burkholderia multivorans]MBR7922773.1 hypothetical protein [Burkholderia multivorans]HEM8494507.1 hypothetical protein [Burkholderia multivorans]